MIRPKFKQSDILKHIENRLLTIENRILERLRVLGEECVIMARSNIDNNPAAFPIAYGSSKKKKPLRQRKITKADRAKNPNVQAPSFGDFLDDTGNLRASIGYAIVKNGQIIDSQFGSKETSKSQRIANNRAKNMRKGYGLIVIAGMEYAEHVETKGYDVISSAEMFAKKEMPKLIEKMKRQL